MSISCLTITQPGRLELLRHAVADFSRQTHAERELLIVHDADVEFECALQRMIADQPDQSIRTLTAPAGLTLGELRNIAVHAARGDWVCQWDDDDRHHPERLQRQFDAAHAQGAEFCFLSEQLQWFPAQRELFWTDWSLEPYPLDFIQGTLLARRSRMPLYPPQRRGEDTALCVQIVQSGARITRLRDAAWLYIYVFHGGNVFSQAHHQAIAAAKALRGARLLVRSHTLAARLAAFVPALGALSLPSPTGALYLAE